VKRALIGGIGNVLLGDDGVGPYVVRVLESEYSFGDNVETADLGTPALDLTHRIVGLHTVILVDCVASEDNPGTVVIYRKADILRETPAQRLDPHSPALSECLMSADMLGAGPENVLLVGIVGGNFQPGCELSEAVRGAVRPAIGAILDELQTQELAFEKKAVPNESNIWWTDERAPVATLPVNCVCL
jgi:hydrogenase maturation protease